MNDERQAAQARLDLLDALLLAQEDLAGLLAAVAASADSAAAQAAVALRFGVSPHMAIAILDMQVRRMSVRERDKVRQERDELLRHLGES